MSEKKYDLYAVGFSDNQYVDPMAYFTHRYELCNNHGPSMKPGEFVLDVGCGDGGFTEILLNNGLNVIACDYSNEMLQQTRNRLSKFIENGSLQLFRVDVNDIRTLPPVEVDYVVATMRTFFSYCHNHEATLTDFYTRTRKKVILDFNPRQICENTVRNRLSNIGFSSIYFIGFFFPQTKRVSSFLIRILYLMERVRVLRFIANKLKFNNIVIAVK